MTYAGGKDLRMTKAEKDMAIAERVLGRGLEGWKDGHYTLTPGQARAIADATAVSFEINHSHPVLPGDLGTLSVLSVDGRETVITRDADWQDAEDFCDRFSFTDQLSTSSQGFFAGAADISPGLSAEEYRAAAAMSPRRMLLGGRM